MMINEKVKTDNINLFGKGNQPSLWPTARRDCQLRTNMKKIIILLICLLLQIGTRAQCPQRYLDEVFSAVKITKNINYGGRKTNTDGTRTWLLMDIYEPKNDTAGLRPLVMLIHGGGFTNTPPLTRGTPDITELAKILARKGYVVVSPEYRLFSGESTSDKTAETAVAAILDINEATCFLVNSATSDNPYRIDTAMFFIGGSSAGAIISLNSAFINDTTEVPESIRPAMRKVAELDQVNLQEILDNKFCGMRPKAVVPISGAFLDTAFVKPIGASLLIIHGMKDGIIPDGTGYALGIQLFGPEIMIDVFGRKGIPYEADMYPNEGHVPVIWPFGDDLAYALEQLLLTGSAVNPPVMDSTQRHITSMFYKLMGSPQTVCPTPTGIAEHIYNGHLQISPNPSSGIFTVELPGHISYKSAQLRIYDLAGQLVLDKELSGRNRMSVDISGNPVGLYFIQVVVDSPEGKGVYVDKIVRQ